MIQRYSADLSLYFQRSKKRGPNPKFTLGAGRRSTAASIFAAAHGR
jgi:hypothetical protein